MVLLDTELVKKFLEMLEVDFRKTREYARKNGMKKEDDSTNPSQRVSIPLEHYKVKFQVIVQILKVVCHKRLFDQLETA